MSNEATQLDWPHLLNEALTVPGRLSDTYCRFYNYSYLNQVLLMMQGAREPVATYKRWQGMGRQVLKGSKSMAILRPLMAKRTDEHGKEETFVRGFKMVNCLFTVSQTEGDPLPEVQPREWSKERALGALAISQVPFDMLDGNTQGYSVGNTIAISPVAKYPTKTLFHELAHVVHGHTAPSELDEYRSHRGLKEFEAEGSAYLAMHELDLGDHMDPAESRAYIRGWLGSRTPSDQSIKRVFAATSKILEAGREPLAA